MAIFPPEKNFWPPGVCAAQPEAQMLAWQQASHLSGDEPQQRRVGPDLLENRQLVGYGRVHLQVLRLHQGAGGADQDNCSEESFILGRSFKRTGYLIFSDRWLNLVEKQRLQMEAVELACTAWEYDKSELKIQTLVAENNWVCQKAPLVQELYFLGNIGLILGIFVFRLPSLKDDFLLSSPYSLVVYHYLLTVWLPTSLGARYVSTLHSSLQFSSHCSRSHPALITVSLLSLRWNKLHCKLINIFGASLSSGGGFLLCRPQVLGHFGWIPLLDSAFNLMCELCPKQSRYDRVWDQAFISISWRHQNSDGLWDD